MNFLTKICERILKCHFRKAFNYLGFLSNTKHNIIDIPILSKKLLLCVNKSFLDHSLLVRI